MFFMFDTAAIKIYFRVIFRKLCPLINWISYLMATTDTPVVSKSTREDGNDDDAFAEANVGVLIFA